MKRSVINPELTVQRWQSGVRLVPSSDPSRTIANMLQLPINFYFNDRDSNIVDINERTVVSCGYFSRPDAIGRSIASVAQSDTATRVIYNDNEVIRTQKMTVVEESYTRFDDKEIEAISIKFPWFDGDNVAGIFGCSIIMEHGGLGQLTESLSLLIQSGLLVPSPLPGLIYTNVYLNRRDADILYWVVRGKTAKNIAKLLNLSHRTIEHRLERIKGKLGVQSKSELIDKVIDHFRR